jgi:hypothetical protein
MKIVPSRAIARPAEASSTYFQAASAAASVPSSATSSAEMMVVTSMATHSSARLPMIGAASMDHANRLSPAQNRRAYRRSCAPRCPEVCR